MFLMIVVTTYIHCRCLLYAWVDWCVLGR